MSEHQASTGGLASAEAPNTPAKVAKAEFKAPPTQNEDGFDFLLFLTKRLEKEDETTDRLFHQKWLKTSKFYEGEHLGRFDSRGQWRSYQPQMGDPYFIHPEMRFHSDSITAAWTQSRPDIRVIPASDDERTVSAARKAEQIIDHYEDVHLTEDFLQREGKLGQFTGQMYRYTCWNPNLGTKKPRFDFEQHEIPLSNGIYKCAECGYEGDEQEVEQIGSCPECGASADSLLHQPGHTLHAQVPKPLGDFPIGDVETECVPAFQVKVDRTQGTFQRSLWIRRRRMVRPEIVKELFPLWNPPTQNSSTNSSNDFGLRAERELQQSVGLPGSGWRTDALTNSSLGVVINQWWLAPCMYASRGPELRDLEFASGLVIPAGLRWIDLFPSGLYLLIIDHKILDLREEYLHDHWQHSPFILIPTRVEGDGIEDLLEPARELDDLMSLVYIDAKANACPSTIVNTTYGVKTSDVTGKPHYVIPARIPTGERIENAVHQLVGRGTPYSLLQYIEMLQSEQQLLAKSFSAATGAPDAVTNGNAANTATSAQLATAAAQGQRSPELAIRAAGSVVWARQVLRLFQKNAVDEHYIPLSGRFGLTEGSYFKGADVEADFILTVRNRSWVPRDEYSRRADLMGAIQSGLLSYELPRAVREEIAEIFNVSITISSDIADTRVARIRLEKMEQLLQQIEQAGAPPDLIPLLLCQMVPLEPLVDNHQAMQEWYIEWMKTDAGLNAPPEFRGAINLRIQEHQQAASIQMQRQVALQMQAMAPQLALQQSQASQQHRQQMQSQAMNIAGQQAAAKDRQTQAKGN